VVTARRLIELLRDAPIRGRVDIVPVANPFAHAARARVTPVDGRNLAREFPGDQDGSPTQLLAYRLTRELIFPADLLIDLHSAGAHYEMPVFVGYCSAGPGGPASRSAAEAFAAPVIWQHPTIGAGRSISAAQGLGVPAVYVEGSGGGGLRGADLDVYVGGVLRVLRGLGMIGPEVGPVGTPADPVVLDGGDGDVDASIACVTAGLCITRATVGDDVRAGTPVAEIIGDAGEPVEVLRAPRAGRLMMLRRTAEVRAGDGIAMFGPWPRSGAQR
jgi:predicted deacylase